MRIKVLLGIGLLAGIVMAARLFNAQQFLEYLRASGPGGVILFIAVYAAATVCFVPGWILTLGAGVIYGVVKGSVVVSVSATAGATLAFITGRYFAREWVAKKIKTNATFKAIDEAVGREGWKIVGLTRLSPVFPFNLLNYAFGLTRVPLKDYFLASWIGMMPGTVMYVYAGSLIGDVAMIGKTERSRTPLEWALYGAGLLATIGVTLYVTRIAKKALSQKGTL